MINTASVNRQKVVSPCVGKCGLDENDTCVGCYRLVSEISGWLDTPEDEKRDIIARCRKRKNISIEDGEVTINPCKLNT